MLKSELAPLPISILRSLLNAYDIGTVSFPAFSGEIWMVPKPAQTDGRQRFNNRRRHLGCDLIRKTLPCVQSLSKSAESKRAAAHESLQVPSLWLKPFLISS